jgi:predicted esterase
MLLTGFSMGGYGVYRTFYETPAKFRAVAVFSGAPAMGRRYAPGENPPDFSDERNLQAFRNIPVFVFHGEKDRNVPIGATRELVGKLQKVGARVEFRVEPDKGHERPSREGIEVFKTWVRQVLR